MSGERWSEKQALRATLAVRNEVYGLVAILAELHDRGGHEALGYESWEAFLAAEFGHDPLAETAEAIRKGNEGLWSPA